ncbi:MAG: ATP-binding protein [Alphaproteobacteria bacterium]|nr:ATP-binding protein [Alphaproteobacteria bacterium]
MSELPCLAGVGVDSGEIENIAVRCGFRTAAGAENADIVLIAKPDRLQLERLLANHPPYALLEAPTPAKLFGKRFKLALERKGLFISLSTSAAFHMELAGLVCSCLGRNVPLSQDKGFDVETALGEALSNAMVHGNLDVASALRNDPADFGQYCDLVNQRLATPTFADRRIEMLATWSAKCLEIEVHDEGRGFDISNVSAIPRIEAKCGRGFSLIRELTQGVTLVDQGCGLKMSFEP